MDDREDWTQLDSVAALVVVLDHEGRIVSFNRACENLTGYSSAEVLGRCFWDVVLVPEEIEDVRSVFTELRSGHFPNEHENYWRTKSGELRWIAWSNTARLDASGEVERVISTGVDISERKRLDDELRRSEERFRVLVERVPDYAIFMLDPEGRVASWNAGAQGITGYAAEEILGLDYAITYTPEDVAAGRPAANLRAAIERGHIEEEGWRVRKDGTRFFAEVSITALRDADGSLRGFAKVTRDATARWMTDMREDLFDEVNDVLGHALPDYDETLQAIARIAVQWFADLCTIALVDEETHGTKRVVTITSDPAAEVSAARLRALPIDRTQFAIMSRVIETRKAELHDLHTYLDETSDLHPEYVDVIRQLDFRSIIVAPLVSRGRALGLVSLVRTRSGPYDENDVRLAQALGDRAGLHIDNARIYRQAQQAIQTRDDVMNIVAHDLRNPLNSIGIQAQLMLRDLAKESGNESLREAVTSIRSSVASMDNLIRDLFDAARSEAGQLVRRIRPCEPSRLVADAVQSVRALAASKKLALTSSSSQDLPLVKADRERVHQVLSNLLGNAIKFTPPGGNIVVSAEHAGAVVAFAVTDTGSGIAADELPHVFDRFWKGKASDRRGAGLGLWICNGIVKSHGGAFFVESAPGRGSTFRFTLPLVPE